jgi:hypothetical protein
MHGTSASGLLAWAISLYAGYLAGGAFLIAVLYVCYPVRFTTILYWTAATIAIWATLLLASIDLKEHVGLWQSAMGWPNSGGESFSLNVLTPWLLMAFFLAPVARRVAKNTGLF